MNSFWIENDLLVHKTHLNTLQTNENSNSFVCWLYMENQKFYITDLEFKLQSTLSNKVKFKQNKPQNNKQNCIKVSIKKYFYSAQLKFIFIYIDELEIKSQSLVNFSEIKLVPAQLKNGGTLVESKFGRTQKSQVSQLNQTSHVLTPTNIRNKTESNKAPSELSMMVNEFSQSNSYANYTIDLKDKISPRPVSNRVLDLNDAFVKTTQENDMKKTQETSYRNTDSLAFISNDVHNNQKVCSQLNELSTLNSFSNISCINEGKSTIINNNNSNITRSPGLKRSSVKILPKNNKLTSSAATSPDRIINETAPHNSEIEQDSEIIRNKKYIEDLSETNITNDEMNSSFSSSSSSPNDFANQISLSSPFGIRKKKLMQKDNKACDQFSGDSQQMTDDESKGDMDHEKISPYHLPKRIANRTYSSSSDSSSVRSLPTGVHGGSVSKTALFASKKKWIQCEKKAFTEKKLTQCRHLFSPKSKIKQPNVRSLLKQLNNSFAEIDKDDEHITLAINKNEQISRRKRLFNPNSQKVDDAFDNDITSMSKERFCINRAKSSLLETPNNKMYADRVFNLVSVMSTTNSTNSMNNNSRHSIPAGQAPGNSASKTNDEIYNDSVSPNKLLETVNNT